MNIKKKRKQTMKMTTLLEVWLVTVTINYPKGSVHTD